MFFQRLGVVFQPVRPNRLGKKTRRTARLRDYGFYEVRVPCWSTESKI